MSIYVCRKNNKHPWVLIYLTRLNTQCPCGCSVMLLMPPDVCDSLIGHHGSVYNQSGWLLSKDWCSRCVFLHHLCKSAAWLEEQTPVRAWCKCTPSPSLTALDWPWVEWNQSSQMATHRSHSCAGTCPCPSGRGPPSAVQLSDGASEAHIFVQNRLLLLHKSGDWKGAFGTIQQNAVGAQRGNTAFCHDYGNQ